MNESLAKYGNRKGCLSRYCSGKKPPDLAFCSSYSCHYSRDFKPGEAWKFYYRQQKIQEYGHQKQHLLKRLSRCHGKDVMQCVVRGLRQIEGLPPASPPDSFEPDFYVRPWQQQFVPPLQDPPCPIHGFDRESPGCTYDNLRSCPPRCFKMAYCYEPHVLDACKCLRFPQLTVNPQRKYAPAPVYLTEPCTQLPNTKSYMGCQQPCLQQEPPWRVPHFCCSDKAVQRSCKEWPDIRELWHLK